MQYWPGLPKWRALTLAIDDPGDLIALLPPVGGLAFLHEGEGFIALGEAARFTTDFPDAADVWWSEFVEDVEHETELPGEYGTGPLAIGSFAFDPSQSTEQSVLIVPEVVVGRRDGKCWLTKIGHTRPDATLPERQAPQVAPTHLSVRPGALDEEAWTAMVAEVAKLLAGTGTEKVVLARDLVATSTTPIDSRYLLARLSENYPGCWSFLVDSLVGATPELLIRLRGGLATTRVLTGSASFDPLDQLGLLRFGTRRRDHAQAVASTQEALRAHCRGMHAPEAPFVLTLANISQLATDITGVVEAHGSSLALTGALHPTVAVCGSPRAQALDLIGEFESMDRGRYAGPVGWVDEKGEGEWAIALRCGQYIDPHTLQLLAGAGITADADAPEKLAATNAKLRPLLDALGIPPTER